MIQKEFMTKICGLKSNFCDDQSLSKQKVWLKKKIFWLLINRVIKNSEEKTRQIYNEKPLFLVKTTKQTIHKFFSFGVSLIFNQIK